MRLPEKAGRIDEAAATEIIDAAIAGGINYFDTAWPYHGGKSEAFTGQALARHERGKLYIATKLPCWLVKSREDVARIFDEQLTRLQTDYVDFYLMHALNAASWDAMDSLGVYEILAEYKAAGKIRQLGFSFHDGYPAFERILRAKPWDFCQIQYNYMDRAEQAGDRGYALAESLGVPVVIMEPLKGGSLANLPAAVSSPLRALNPTASDASWSFRWLAAKSGIRVVLSGMSNRAQLDENLALFSGLTPLSAEEAVALDSTAGALRARVRNACSSCSYCMPCPHGVDIPRNFRQWNYYGMYEDRGAARWQWHEPGFASARADRCVGCQECVEKCPQRIPIPSDLAKAAAELGALKRVQKA
jgi:predicted aldo/keto reductase-like oxidoreductase